MYHFVMTLIHTLKSTHWLKRKETSDWLQLIPCRKKIYSWNKCPSRGVSKKSTHTHMHTHSEVLTWQACTWLVCKCSVYITYMFLMKMANTFKWKYLWISTCIQNTCVCIRNTFVNFLFICGILFTIRILFYLFIYIPHKICFVCQCKNKIYI